jgi:hypothetical protein
LGREVGGARFQPFGEARQAFLRFIRAHRFLPPPIPHLFLRLKVSIPGVLGVLMKVIVTHGDLRERIPEVSGRRVEGQFMNCRYCARSNNRSILKYCRREMNSGVWMGSLLIP